MCTGPIEQRAHVADLRAALARDLAVDAARDLADRPGLVARLRAWLGLAARDPLRG